MGMSSLKTKDRLNYTGDLFTVYEYNKIVKLAMNKHSKKLLNTGNLKRMPICNEEKEAESTMIKLIALLFIGAMGCVCIAISIMLFITMI